MAKYNDLDIANWKNYNEIYTDTLWLIDKRDNSGMHSGSYHGNFIPQIPYQLFKRYTKKNDWVLDPFAGSGTSLIEAKYLGRNGIGIELLEEIAIQAKNRIPKEINPDNKIEIYIDDSRTFNLNKVLQNFKIRNVQFVIFHPPYWNIIKFSEDKRDLSNANSIEEFLFGFGKVIDNACGVLEKNRYCAIVIGDMYLNSEIVPLGFKCMNLFLDRGYKLKAIIVKNFEETKGKLNQKQIWRYRALASDFYIFKHEYIMVFKKVK